MPHGGLVAETPCVPARGAAIVDICIDGGGVAETSRPTTHARPTYVEEGVVHYCVGNMPAADPRASTAALAAAVLPFARELIATREYEPHLTERLRARLLDPADMEGAASGIFQRFEAGDHLHHRRDREADAGQCFRIEARVNHARSLTAPGSRSERFSLI